MAASAADASFVPALGRALILCPRGPPGALFA
jgi:hypothetical protein